MLKVTVWGQKLPDRDGPHEAELVLIGNTMFQYAIVTHVRSTEQYLKT
jgi:hypothetical protein